MVADTVAVHSKDVKNNSSHLWISNGKDNYTIEELKKENRGTKISLNIKKILKNF